MESPASNDSNTIINSGNTTVNGGNTVVNSGNTTVNRLYGLEFRNANGVSCQNAVDDFIEKNKNLPAQGSPEWVAFRQYTIGGSEITKAMGTNSSKRAIAESKLGLSPIFKNFYMNWGNIMEQQGSYLMEFLFKAQLYSTGSIRGMEHNGVCIQTYSPDGLMIVKKDRLLSILKSNVNYVLEYDPKKVMAMPDEMIILFEFKSTIKRIPCGKLIDDYLYQPPLGLATIAMTDMALFTDIMLRPCSIDQFNFTKDFNKIDMTDKNFVDFVNSGITDAIAIGWLGIREKVQLYLFSEDIKKAKLALDKLNDMKASSFDIIMTVTRLLKGKLFLINQVLPLGLIAEWRKYMEFNMYINKIEINDITDDPEQLKKIFQDINVEKLKYEVTYSDGYLFNPKYDIKDGLGYSDHNQWLHDEYIKFYLDTLISGYNVHGIMPWKMLRISIVPVYRDPNFYDIAKSHVLTIMNVVNELKDTYKDYDDPEPKYIEGLNKAFGEKRQMPSRNSAKNIIIEEPTKLTPEELQKRENFLKLMTSYGTSQKTDSNTQKTGVNIQKIDSNIQKTGVNIQSTVVNIQKTEVNVQKIEVNSSKTEVKPIMPLIFSDVKAPEDDWF